MNYRFLFALFAIAAPLVTGSYAPNGYLSQGSNGLEELVNAASGGSSQAAQSITANAEAQPTPAENARLGQAQAQLQALNANPTYKNMQNSESIAESLAESTMAVNMRQGNGNIVAPNVAEQDLYRSMLVPSGPNNHQIIATQPLPRITVVQPGAPTQQVISGPAAIVRAAPVIYKLKPSVIFQQEVINKVPAPLSLNPVYVKVYKPGKKIDAPTVPVLQQAQQFNGAGNAGDIAANFGAGNLGAGSINAANFAAGNIGAANLAAANLAAANLGVGNLGINNLGNLGNLGINNLGINNLGIGNIGAGGAGSAQLAYTSQASQSQSSIGSQSYGNSAYGSQSGAPAYQQAGY